MHGKEMATMHEAAQLSLVPEQALPEPSQDEEPLYENSTWAYRSFGAIMWLMAVWVALKVWFVRIFMGNRTFEPSQLERSHLLFDKFSEPLHAIRLGATSWKALDVIYNFQPHMMREGLFVTMITNFWLGMMNAQAVRNRLKMVKCLVKDAILEYAAGGNEVRILTLASGSAQGVIEVIASLDVSVRRQIKVIAIDYDQDALEHGEELANRAGVGECFTWVCGSILRLPFEQYQPHIVEMLGFLDYLNDKRAVSLLSKIRKAMIVGGTMFTCNIAPNPEMFFLRWVIGWKMIYRSQSELLKVVLDSEYERHRVAVYVEPHQIHTIVAAQS